MQKSLESGPFLRWAGSKRKLLPSLAAYWQADFNKYVEPFVGCGALFFHLDAPASVISDQNPHLIRLYKVIRRRWKAVADRLSQMPVSPELYYQIRSKAFSSKDEVEFAADFLYLNRNCFNGLYRTNNSGMFNVPFSGSRTGGPISASILEGAAKRLRKADIREADFESVVMDVDPRGTFFYLDPPYAVRNKRIFRQYGPDTFGIEDLDRLDACLEHIDNNGGHFLLSYANEREIRPRYRRWHVQTVSTIRNIAGFAKHRGEAKEILVSNFLPTRRGD